MIQLAIGIDFQQHNSQDAAFHRSGIRTARYNRPNLTLAACP